MIRRKHTIALLGALLALLIVPSASQADFGIEPGSLKTTFEVAEGLPGVPQASSHPYAFTLAFNVNGSSSGVPEGGEMRNILVDLPPGFAGDPFAVDRCTRQEFEGTTPNCSPNSQVGVLVTNIEGIPSTISGPIYNMVPPPGVAAQLGFAAGGLNALQNISVHSEEGTPERYGLGVDTFGLPLPVLSLNYTIWGVPADASHDTQRGKCLATGGAGCVALSLPYVGPHKPFLTLPADCSKPIKTTVKINSALDPEHYVSESTESMGTGGQPTAPEGCQSVPFHPAVAASATSRLTSNPSGFDFELKLPNEGFHNQFGIAETEPHKVEVTLPQGLTANPSFAEGLGTCSEAQYLAEGANTPVGAGCPESSKLGSVVANSPVLDEPITGSLYIAAPYENKFHSLLALYMVLRAPQRGVLVKQAGEITPDPTTGQLHTTFEDLPPLPFSDFTLHFREGARAPLATPQACGEYVTSAQLYPFSAPDTPTERQASFQISRGADGGACPTGGTPPFHPGLIAGSINNAAGAYSPFNVRMFRNDSEQEITHFSIKLPPGIAGKLAGIPYCPEANIAAAKARENTSGAGQEELDHPSCPQASEVGHTLVGVGVGSALTYVPGKIYLAGPYHGSNLSIVAITAAKVGPFDVGTVVVRQALKIDPETAEASVDGATSDPIPHIIAGIPVHLRDIRAYVDRPDFVLNPTSCKPTSTASTLLGSGTNFATEADDQPVTVSTRYQAADCASLPFAPKLSLSLKGGTKRGQTPALKAVLTARKGEANTAGAQITLPHSEFLEQAHIGTVCTRVQFKEGKVPGEKCPPASIYGKVSAITPILSEPLKGPVYLRSSSHPLPDLVATLHNAQVDIALAGRIDSVQNGRIRNTFEAVPDAPVTKFTLEMQGGKKGLLVNSTDLCKRTNRALSHFTGQNGKVSDTNPALVAQGCTKAKKKKAKAKAHKRAAKRLALRSTW